MDTPSVQAQEPQHQSHAWLTTFLLPIITLVLGSAVGLAGTWLGNNTQDDFAAGQTMQQERTSAYQSFEAAANAYAVNVSSSISKLQAACSGKNGCSVSLGTLDSSRASFQMAINAIYTYGSDAAVTASRAVAATLPPSLWSTSTVDLTFSQSSFASAYQGFLRVACQDLPAQPRSDC